jgi:hypothetical protein
MNRIETKKIGETHREQGDLVSLISLKSLKNEGGYTDRQTTR